ncbi:MAG TPA: hypothetical protein VMZ28_16355 [Kofleriaceae bacterium]|nr:hypothetical protein [Kofleriaceae bacterium]
MDTQTLAGLARARGLQRMADAILTVKRPLTGIADPSLASPLPAHPVEALELFPRRGLDPRLIATLLPWFAGRPLELGLFSWDVLASAVLEEGALVDALRANARAVAPLLPAPGSTFANVTRRPSVLAVKEQAAPPYRQVADEEIDDVILRRALGALEELRRRHGLEFLKKTKILETTRQFAQFLHLAHLSTLSSFYLDYLFKGLDHRPAGADLVEVLLDVGARSVLPGADQLMGDGSAEEVELVGYMAARAELIGGRYQAIHDQLREGTPDANFRTVPLDELARFARSHIVYAMAALELKRYPVSFALLNRIIELHPNWRYAHRVRVAVSAALADPASDGAVPLVDQFLGRFGNDFGLWHLTARYAPPGAPWLEQLRGRLVGEVSALPHDWAAWAALAQHLGAQEAIRELDQRMVQQCTL